MSYWGVKRTNMGRRYDMDFDREKLGRLIRFSPPRSEFFKFLKQELTKIGRWKRLARGRHAPKPGSNRPSA